jgi:amino acid permease
MKLLSTVSLFLAVVTTSASAFTTSVGTNTASPHRPISTLTDARSKAKIFTGQTGPSKVLLRASGGHADAPTDDGVATATIPNEIFNLVKSIIGAGVLSLPAGIAAMGNAPSAVIPATALIAIMGIISAYTFSMIARVCKYTGATSYADAWDKTRGTKISWLIAASSALDCFSGNLSYSMVLADTFRDLFSAVGLSALATRSNALLAITGTVLFPLCLTKNLSSLAPFSLLGIMGMAYTSIAIAIRYFGGSYALPAGKFLSDLTPDLQPSFGSIGASGALSSQSLILICMLSTAYIAHFNAPKFFRELKNNTVNRFNIVTASSFGISIFIYAAVSAMGFLTFGYPFLVQPFCCGFVTGLFLPPSFRRNKRWILGPIQSSRRKTNGFSTE